MPKVVAPRSPSRPGALTGARLSTGKARYGLTILDDDTGMGWIAFTKDKSRTRLEQGHDDQGLHRHPSWRALVKDTRRRWGNLEYVFMDNGHEFTNKAFRGMLAKMDIKSSRSSRRPMALSPSVTVALSGQSLSSPRSRERRGRSRFPRHLLPCQGKVNDCGNIWPES